MAKRDPGKDDMFTLEDSSGDKVTRACATTHPQCDVDQIDGVPSKGYKSVTLDSHQRAAVEMALSKKLTLINAGPGTGKSTTLSVLMCELMMNELKPTILFLSFSPKQRR